MSEAQLLTVYWIFAAERYGAAVYLKENQLSFNKMSESVHSPPGAPATGNKVCDKIVDNAKTADEENNKEENCWSQEDFETFKKLLDESFSKLAKRSDILGLCEKTKVEKNDVKNEEDNESLEDAKLWAKKQKSTWLKK